MRSCIFSIITPVFSVTWSSEIILIYWLAAQETFLIIINAENSCAAQYFCGNRDIFYFSGYFCNIINVFTVTFDQFNASLINKSINFLKKVFWTQTYICILYVYMYMCVCVVYIYTHTHTARTHTHICMYTYSIYILVLGND